MAPECHRIEYPLADRNDSIETAAKKDRLNALESKRQNRTAHRLSLAAAEQRRIRHTQALRSNRGIVGDKFDYLLHVYLLDRKLQHSGERLNDSGNSWNVFQ